MTGRGSARSVSFHCAKDFKNMSNETAKANKRRAQSYIFQKVFSGKGIDIIEDRAFFLYRPF